MNAKVHDLMSPNVVTTQPHRDVDHVRKMMENAGIGSIPVVDSEDHPVGMISASDLAAPGQNGRSPISQHMSDQVLTVPGYEEVSTAARIMRNHKIHHLVVTHEKKVVGMLSAFDLLRLVEDHRYVAKPPPPPSKRKGSRRS